MHYNIPYRNYYNHSDTAIMRKTILLLFTLLSTFWLSAQTDSLGLFDYSLQQEFEIGAIKVSGANYSDDNAIIGVSGLKVGNKIQIPGNDIPKAIKSLWKLRLFTDVQIIKEKNIGDVIFLEISVKERPRLSRHSYRGVKKSQQDDLNDEISSYLLKGAIVTEDVKANAAQEIKDFYFEKGYLDTEVNVVEINDSSRVNAVRLVFDVDRGDRIKISEINFHGNEHVKDKKLRKQLKETKRKGRIFSSSKFLSEEYKNDKKNLVAYYNTIGFRDARVISDSFSRDEKGHLQINIDLEEGQRYYFNNIVWKGNSIHDTEKLQRILGINKGDVYNQELLTTRLTYSEDGRDVSTLYMDDGYLSFRVDPVEVAISEDSIDLELRVYEGPQFVIDKIEIKGNDRTHEHVIRREIRTVPGQKFSRSDIIRSQRQLMNLGYFNPEALGINTPVNPERGTVDIEYTVEERPSDQLELSAGWSGAGVIGTLGVSFNNFSMRNAFKKGSWRPVPMGDGQRLSLRAQTNGSFYQSYNVSFTEPWLGGKKPTSLTVSAYYNRLQQGRKEIPSTYGYFDLLNFSVGVGTRLRWPDDNFISSTSINAQFINLNNYFRINGFFSNDGELIREGNFNNFSIKQTFSRNTVNEPIFPRTGSTFSVSVKFTPPYSLLNNKDYSDISNQEKYKFLEYHKWDVDAAWYTPIVGNLILKAGVKMGYLGAYNKELGLSPFERYQLGGDGINNSQFTFTGVDIISLRGYEIEDLENNTTNGTRVATPLYNKYTLELRYPISTNPSSTIYTLGFLQAGNSWKSGKDFNPFDLKRSAGVGLRVFLPMFGILGFDYGFGFDKEANNKGQIGKFSIILGFEPE